MNCTDRIGGTCTEQAQDDNAALIYGSICTLRSVNLTNRSRLVLAI